MALSPLLHQPSFALSSSLSTQPWPSPSKSYVFTGSALRLRPNHHHPAKVKVRVKCSSLSSAVEVSGSGSQGGEGEKKQLLLQVSDLTAEIVESKREILRGVNLTIYQGEVHAIMGKNGSGKSTFAKVLAGHPDYRVTGGSIVFKGESLVDMAAEDRSLLGLFMSFQTPIEIPGVTNIDFLNMAYNARRKKLGLPELGPIEFYGYVYPKLALVNMKTEFLNRNVNQGFSGGEKKRNEILQLAVLGAELAVLDEIDSGLDVDAFRDIAKAVNELLTPKNSVLMITHYERLLQSVKPTCVHIMEDGKIVKTGDISLAGIIDDQGYEAIA